MSEMTDPALDLSELCEELLRQNDNVPGHIALASHFNTEPWSVEFFEILFVITRRIDQLAEMVVSLKLRPTITDHAISHLKTLKNAFNQNGLQNQWSHSKTHYLSPAVVGPIRVLSIGIKPQYGYVKLNADEIVELVVDVDKLLEWLHEHQLREQDFFRASIIEGLTIFRFRLERLSWLGWGYALHALRDVISAYLAYHGHAHLQAEPATDAILRKVVAYVGRVCKAAHVARDAAETAEFMLKAYGAVSLIAQGKQSIAGLLTYGGG